MVAQYVDNLSRTKTGLKKLTYKDLPARTVNSKIATKDKQNLIVSSSIGTYILTTAEALEKLAPVVQNNPDGSKDFILPKLMPRSAGLTDKQLMAEIGTGNINEITFFSALSRLKEKFVNGEFFN